MFDVGCFIIGIIIFNLDSTWRINALTHLLDKGLSMHCIRKKVLIKCAKYFYIIARIYFIALITRALVHSKAYN